MGMTLYSKRLMLRLLEAGDAAEIEQIAGDKEIAETTLAIPHPYPAGASSAFIRRRQAAAAQGDGYSWTIRLKESGRLLGIIGLRIDKQHHHAELGYWIGKRYWGQGYCTEAAERVAAFVFEQLKLNKMFAAAMIKNPASSKVMEKIGMRHEGIFREHVYKDGQYEDLTYYSLLRSEYKPNFKLFNGIN
ncbi:GNAT family N-acetyltransferase [Paenibacillus sp. GCM10027626]|uniref:GNAT family N-acetyltransferase n=1 Tax=Paenibacillus sp. GCM10027626 TaxID=3273411 RepID=UPI003633CB48